MNSGESKQVFLHKAQISILKSLRHVENARFTELMRPTGLTSDNFKFYLRELVKLGWIKKAADGLYELTSSGKELANNLDETRQTIQKQPKVSVLIIASRQNADDETEYLFQQRLRHPYYGMWGSLTGPVQWGESIELTAQVELHKQTGLSAEFEIRSFCRVTDHDSSGSLLEDKLFAVVVTTKLSGYLDAPWDGGINEWMTLATLATQAKYFPLTADLIELAESSRPYASFVQRYSLDDY
jgi:predicted transcriptional regulator/ADP-ribose pyrophosphatase YjhB (NUDIX family)